MKTVTFYSNPYRDPQQVNRKNTPDWLVNEVGNTDAGQYVQMHRFMGSEAENRAQTFTDHGRELLDREGVAA